MNERQFQTMTALRIYLKRGDNKKATRWWGRFLEKPLSSYLVKSALNAGITHAAVNLGHMGFAKDAKAVSYEGAEIPMSTLPVCVELLAPKRILNQFIREEAKHLKDTTLLMVDGIHISPLYLSEMENALRDEPHHVEYVTEGRVTLPVETVSLNEAPDEFNVPLPVTGPESTESMPSPLQ
jgi:PII-like signaling protein